MIKNYRELAQTRLEEVEISKQKSRHTDIIALLYKLLINVKSLNKKKLNFDVFYCTCEELYKSIYFFTNIMIFSKL